MFIVCVLRTTQAPSGAAWTRLRPPTTPMPLLTELAIASSYRFSINMSPLRGFGQHDLEETLINFQLGILK